MFVLFDEEKTIMEFAKRGMGFKITHPVPEREPQVGWLCSTCGKVMRLSKAPEGHCLNCLSPVLETIFGEQSFHDLTVQRKKRMNELRSQQRRKHGPQY